MIIYGIINRRVITSTRNELAKKIMYEKFNGKYLLKNIDEVDPDFGYIGDNDSPQLVFIDSRVGSGFHVGISKVDDPRWWENPFYQFSREWVGFGISGWKERKKLQFMTTHKELLTIDKRALYILVVEIMTEVGGEISEDDQKTWISLEEFKSRHQDILSLSYEEANELSLKEALTYNPTEERNPDTETPEEYAARGWDWEWSNAEHEEDDGPTSNKKI